MQFIHTYSFAQIPQVLLRLKKYHGDKGQVNMWFIRRMQWTLVIFIIVREQVQFTF